MKLLSWVLLAVGAVVFFSAPDQLIGWIGMMTAVTGLSIIIVNWSVDSGYAVVLDEARRPLDPRAGVKQNWLL